MKAFLFLFFAILFAIFSIALVRLLYAGIPYEKWVEIERKNSKR